MYEGITQYPIGETISVLPTGASLNPSSPDASKHPYYRDDTVVYVLYKLNERRTRATRVLTSFGPISGWRIGTTMMLHHDQTAAFLGEYMIVGVKDFGNGEEAGDVPDLSIKHAVLK